MPRIDSRKFSVIASRLLYDRAEVASMVTVDLPSIALATQDVAGPGVMGSINMPVTGGVNSMETTITMRGHSYDAGKLMRPGEHKMELRFAQDSFTVQQGIRPEGCKIFMTVIFKSAEGGSIKNMEFSERAFTYEVRRYEEYVDGEQTVLIDKWGIKYQMVGEDGMQDVRGFIY